MKKKIKGIVLVMLASFTLFGCSQATGKNKTTTDTQYDVSSKLKQLNMDELKKKITDKEEFVVMVTQSTCTYCNTMKRTIIPYFRVHKDVPFYELELDMLGDKVEDTNKNISLLQKLVPSFTGATPEFFHYKDGEKKTQISGEVSEIAWDNFMIDTGLVKAEKQKEEKVDNALADSGYFKTKSVTEIADLIKAKNDFYLLFVQEDRYSAAFTKTLKTYAEKNKMEIIILNNSAIGQPATQEESDKMTAAIGVINKAVTIEFAPSLFHVKEGKSIESLKDNVSMEEVEAWFKKQK